MGGAGVIGMWLSYRTANVRITHEESATVHANPWEVPIIVEPEVTPTMLTRIELWQRDMNSREQVLLHWKPFSSAEFVGIHFDDDTQTLFVGAATVAAAVRIPKRHVISQHKVTLFWHFEPEGDYVVQLGELDVFLHRRTGEIVARAPVDPPYDMTRTPEGIRFDSPVYGTQWLRFPDTPPTQPPPTNAV
jgi:hypothetical protein